MTNSELFERYVSLLITNGRCTRIAATEAKFLAKEHLAFSEDCHPVDLGGAESTLRELFGNPNSRCLLLHLRSEFWEARRAISGFGRRVESAFPDDPDAIRGCRFDVIAVSLAVEHSSYFGRLMSDILLPAAELDRSRIKFVRL